MNQGTDSARRDNRTGNATVGVCQFEPAVGETAANVERIHDLCRRLDGEVELAAFPELCVSGYDLDCVAEVATPVPGATTDRLVDVAARHGLYLGAGLPERAGDRTYNSYVLLSPDGVEHVYRKPCLWGDEGGVFDAGDDLVVAETPVGTVGFLLCYDLNFPEFALSYAADGCDVVVVGAAWRESYRADWRLLSRTRALDGPCYVVAANHAGDQRGRQHAGESLVAGPRGDVLASAGTGEATVSASVSTDALSSARERNPVQETRAETSLPVSVRAGPVHGPEMN